MIFTKLIVIGLIAMMNVLHTEEIIPKVFSKLFDVSEKFGPVLKKNTRCVDY